MKKYSCPMVCGCLSVLRVLVSPMSAAALALGAVSLSAEPVSSGAMPANVARDTYYLNDHLATTVATMDAAAIIAQVEMDAFGGVTAGSEFDARYTGKPYDEDLGAYRFSYRNYSTNESHWITSDPSGFPNGTNRHVLGPFESIDRDGLSWTQSSQFSNIYYDSGISSNDISYTENTLTYLNNINADLSNLFGWATGGGTGSSPLLISGVGSGAVSGLGGSTSGWYNVGSGDITDSSGLPSASLFSVIFLDFGSGNFVDSTSSANLSQSEGEASAAAVLAHELSHAVFHTVDPDSLPQYDEGHDLRESSVWWENQVRWAESVSYRANYGQVGLNSDGWRE